MKKYYFFRRGDQTRESISVCEAMNIHEAIEKFAKAKHLDRKEFLDLFKVKEVGSDYL